MSASKDKHGFKIVAHKRTNLAGSGQRGLRNGFTLLEVMVAMSIIAIVLLAVYRLHSQTLMMNYSARFYTTAPLLAQKKLSELELSESDALIDETGNFGEDHAGYGWEVSVGNIESELLKTAAENLKRIDLKITFNQDELAYTLRTYRYYR
jgi:general secretion pathway protein I